MFKVPSFNHIQERRTGVRSPYWLVSPLAILKLLLATSFIISAVFLVDGRLQWAPYTLIFVFSLLFIIYSLLSLLAHFFNISDLKRKTVIGIEVGVNIIGCLLSILAFLLLCWDELRMRDGHWHHHSRLAPRNIGEEGWRKRIAVVMGSMLINVCLFFFTFLRIRKDGFD